MPFQNPVYTFLIRTTQLPMGISHSYEFGIAQTWRCWKDNSKILPTVSFFQLAVEYKSSKRRGLVKAGYRIIGNTGDQWTDLIGENVGSRIFKVHDPMYYIG
ncbi:hypothetical protein MTR67_028437 [Solanum verrucosum]|uniref:Acid phosphatase n=1 Tax=Solanum verrucosum TaxID=315347 RepID=A0AAF0R2H4_SOLVR|nr:hypothetical protein MTR67_028437 [Solanum verrucosum]